MQKAAELSMFAPQVVALRTARMLAAGAYPNARDRAEFMRMGTEKVQAFGESMNAMAAQMYRANQDFALLAMRQWWSGWMMPWQFLGAWRSPLGTFGSSAAQRQMQRSMLKIMDRGLAPVHKRARANARRLSRSKKR